MKPNFVKENESGTWVLSTNEGKEPSHEIVTQHGMSYWIYIENFNLTMPTPLSKDRSRCKRAEGKISANETYDYDVSNL